MLVLWISGLVVVHGIAAHGVVGLLRVIFVELRGIVGALFCTAEVANGEASEDGNDRHYQQQLDQAEGRLAVPGRRGIQAPQGHSMADTQHHRYIVST